MVFIMLKKISLLTIIFIIIIIRIITINIIDRDKYIELYNKKVNNYVYGASSPRGRIIDRNGKVLVDNIGIKILFYKKIENIKQEEELEIASKLASIIDIKIDDNSLKDYYLIINNNGDNLISDEEYKLYRNRKISNIELYNIKLSRITDNMLNELSEIDKKTATIYRLMNKGYSYDNKIIYKNISDIEYEKIIESNLKGVFVDLTWERKYNYGDTLKDIFGSVGYISIEDKDYYLDKGYELNDIVGLSYLEKYYENYLKGEKDLYKVSNNRLVKIKEGRRGNDIILSIDIDTQIELERIIREYMSIAKKRSNTDYFSELYSMVGNPLTGEIIALSGQKYVDDNTFINVNTNLINTSYTVGSIVKIGTVSAGYKYNVIDIGTSVNDGCIKLYQVPAKCSYKRLGRVNDLTSISKSSNYYQFRIALGLTNNKYSYNMKIDTTNEDFNKLRNMYKEYGLGMLTGIDLDKESIGIIGRNTSSDLLLNLSIGQYDTYTPIELFQYVNTIASLGEKRKPQLMKEISNIKENNYSVVSKVPLDNKYLFRLKDAMHMATTSGTARGFISSKYKGAGKTGTSETFIDTNHDGIMDTKTTSIGFIGFAPYDNPKYSIIVLAPHIYTDKNHKGSKYYITRYISKDITNFLFEK